MSQARPSSTALGAALMRAVHRQFDAPPRILDDPLAMGLCGIPDPAALEKAAARLHGEFAQRAGPALADDLVRQLRASILLRNRYAEDLLAEAAARGVGQYVLLGAGLDSFALRAPSLAARLQIFELDRPDTQAYKRARLEAMGLALPPNLHLVPADLERQAPLAALAGSAFDPSAPAFFSWLGVTSYLSPEAILATLRDLAAAAPGSELVFSYALAESEVDPETRRINQALIAGVQARGEPAASRGFVPAALAQQLRDGGFSQVRDLDAQEAQARYFAGRGDGLRAPGNVRMMSGRVG